MWKSVSRWLALSGVALMVAVVLSGCSGSSNVLGGGGGQITAAQLANQVFVGSYAPSGANPGGTFRVAMNNTGNAGTVTVFDPLLGTITGPVAVTFSGDTARIVADIDSTGSFSLGQAPSGRASVGRAPGTQAALVPGLRAALAMIFDVRLVHGHNFSLSIISFLLNNLTRVATVSQVIGTNPLSGKSFSGNFTTSAVSGNYNITVGANGSDVTITGNVTNPQLLAGSFAGSGNVGPIQNGQATVTANASGTSGLLAAANARASFQGTFTLTPATAPTSATLTGDVFFNNQRFPNAFSVTVPLTSGGGGGSFPIGAAAGSYRGSVSHVTNQGSTLVGNFQVRLDCLSRGTVELQITLPGSTFQRSSTNTSKTLVGTVTGYNPTTRTISLTISAFDADPQVPVSQRNVTISGTVQLTVNGANVTGAGNLSDTQGSNYRANLTTFTPNQSGCP